MYRFYRAVSTNWMLGDNQGTIRDVVDGNGSLINHVVYDSFGKMQSQSNTGYELRFGYTGREQDGETGLNYYRARYYDSANGRFISEDPIGFDAGDGNLTRYVSNSPVNGTDPSGLRDTRWPFNGSVINLSNRPIYPLISNLNEDHYEKLDPQQQTPDLKGFSKDVDGVWVPRRVKVEEIIQDKWFFFPIRVGNNEIANRLSGNTLPLLKVYNDRVEDSNGNRIHGWNLDAPNTNLDSCPNNPNNPQQARGRESARIHPDPQRLYPDASKYVRTENTFDWKTILMQTVERDFYPDPRVERRGLRRKIIKWDK